MSGAPHDKLIAWKLLVEAHAYVLDGVERELERGGGVPLAWYEVLSRLRRAPDSALRMQDLAAQLLLSRSGATRLIDRIESAGLIERRICSEDRRGTLATLTAAGEAAHARAQPLVLRALDERFAGELSERDARRLQAILRRIVARDAHAQPGEHRPAPATARAR